MLLSPEKTEHPHGVDISYHTSGAEKETAYLGSNEEKSHRKVNCQAHEHFQNHDSESHLGRWSPRSDSTSLPSLSQSSLLALSSSSCTNPAAQSVQNGQTETESIGSAALAAALLLRLCGTGLRFGSFALGAEVGTSEHGPRGRC